jgi:hypothetical protein
MFLHLNSKENSLAKSGLSHFFALSVPPAVAESWVASHGRFLARKSHGPGSTAVSRRENGVSHKKYGVNDPLPPTLAVPPCKAESREAAGDRSRRILCESSVQWKYLPGH